MKKNGNKKGNIKAEGYGIFRRGITAFFIATVAGALLVLLEAVLLFYIPRGEAYIAITGTVIGLLLAFGGGFLAGKLGKSAGALAGLAFGALYLCMMLLLGHFFYTGAPFFKRLLGYLLFPALAALGGAIGGYRPKRSHHTRHRR